MKNLFFNVNDNFNFIIQKQVKEIKSVKKIHSAWTNFVYLVEADTKKIIFRFPRNNFFAKALKKEIRVSNALYTYSSLPVNKLTPKKTSGKIFSMHFFIDGDCLTDVYEDFSLKEKKQFCKEIISYIKSIQEIKKIKRLPKLSTFLEELTRLSLPTNICLPDFTRLKEMEKEKTVLCHGDLNPGNILLKNHSICCIIDFAFASYSNALIDLSRLISRLPNEYYNYLIDEYEKTFHTVVNLLDLNYLINLWEKIEKNYIEYMKVYGKDICLPKFFY